MITWMHGFESPNYDILCEFYRVLENKLSSRMLNQIDFMFDTKHNKVFLDGFDDIRKTSLIVAWHNSGNIQISCYERILSTTITRSFTLSDPLGFDNAAKYASDFLSRTLGDE